MRAHVIDVLEIPERGSAAVLRIAQGEVRIGAWLDNLRTGARWQITGISVQSRETRQNTGTLVMLRKHAGAGPLASGDELVSIEQAP